MNNEENGQQIVAEDWFTKPEILEEMRTMSDGELRELLLAIVGTRTWIAILKYADERYKIAQSGLAIYDPFKNATDIARCQGILSAIKDLPAAIAHLVAEQRQLAQNQSDQK